MKKRYVVIGLLASSLVSFGQRTDSTYRKKKLSSTDVQIMMSYYTQDNDHSAVTGGIGTENLQVYAAQFSIDNHRDSIHTFHMDTGLDIISSASTDNIDFVKSSASKVDGRTHVNVGYSRLFKQHGITAGMQGGLSFESDYLSWGLGFMFNKLNNAQTREFSVSFQTYFDDLRWGRLHKDDTKELKLVYPVELRGTNWFDKYRRTSYNLEVGLFQVINRRMTFGVYPGISYQSGLLSTPFHRVYFTDDTERVENLPGSRLKIPIGLQLNTFIAGNWIVRTYYRFYWDDFGILAHTLNIESPLKLTSVFTLSPNLRIYSQTGADYFERYGKHDTSAEFYTSDYDLSSFTSFKPGLNLRYAPFLRRRGTTFNSVDLRYSFYSRSDGLKAHMVTLFIDYTVERRRKSAK